MEKTKHNTVSDRETRVTAFTRVKKNPNKSKVWTSRATVSRKSHNEVKRTYGTRAVILSGSQTINPDFVPPPSVYVPGRSPESVQDTRDEQS